MVLQEIGHFFGVFTVSFHAQAECFKALHDQKGIERSQSGAGIAQGNHAAAPDESRCAKGFGIDHAVVGGVRLVEHGELRLVGGPVKLPGVDHHTCYGGAVATNVLGE